MTGLDKMISQIEEEAKKEAEGCLEAAEKKAESLMAEEMEICVGSYAQLQNQLQSGLWKYLKVMAFPKFRYSPGLESTLYI